MKLHDEALRDYGERLEEQPDERFALSIAGEGLSSRVTPDKRPVSKAELGRDELASISYPKGIYHSSMKAKLLRTFFYEGVTSESDDALAITAKVMETLDTAQSPEKIATLVQEFIDEGYIVAEATEDDEYAVDLHKDLIDIGNKPLRPIEFVIDGQSIIVDAKDMRSMNIKQLVMTEILHMSTYDLSGIPQSELLQQFLSIVKRNGETDLEEILQELTSDGMVNAKNGGDKQMTLKGKTYIMNFLNSIDAATPFVEDYDDDQPQAAKDFMEEAVLARRPIYLGPRNEKVESLQEHVDIRPIEQASELSPETTKVIRQLEIATQELRDYLEAMSEDPFQATVDTSRVILGIHNKQEAQLVVTELSRILNTGLGETIQPLAQKVLEVRKEVKGIDEVINYCSWKVIAFADGNSKEFIPMVFSMNKLYNVEAMTGFRDVIAPDFRKRVLGNAVVIQLERRLTIKDVLDLLKSDRTIEDIHSQSKGQFDFDKRTSVDSRQTLYSGLNGLRHLGSGRMEYYPGIAYQSQWAVPTQYSLLAETE